MLKDEGTLWLNLGSSYASSPPGNTTLGVSAESTLHGVNDENAAYRTTLAAGHATKRNTVVGGFKPKDLVPIPWMVAMALQADGWWLRQDIIWCLSGGAKVYARTQKGEMPTTIKDLVRLDPSTVQLWNGEKWTQVLGWRESMRPEEPLEIELRSGERIGCTPGHLWPTQRGNVRADDLLPGDIIKTCRLPEPLSLLTPAAFGADAAWLVGLYLAEGSWVGDAIQLASHIDEVGRRVGRVAGLVQSLGGTIHSHAAKGNAANIIIECPPLAAMIRQYVRGRSAKGKGLKVRTWRHPNEWLAALLDGYLAGDGHYDEANGRWRLGFTRNDALAADLRTLAARLGHRLTLKATHGEGFGRLWPIYRGELRMDGARGHHNEKDRAEVVSIGRSRARHFWDIGVADEPHTFALASGVLTHNSKPNPMPESVRDRCTKAHEYVFLLSKSGRYWYDAEAVKEIAVYGDHPRNVRGVGKAGTTDGVPPGTKPHSGLRPGWAGPGPRENEEERRDYPSTIGGRQPGNTANRGGYHKSHGGRNRRSVWTVATQPFPGAHFAVMPEALVEPCILAGCPSRVCASCGAPWERDVVRVPMVIDRSERTHGMGQTRASGKMVSPAYSETVGFIPTCSCEFNHAPAPTKPGTVLDPFWGSGTVGVVAQRLGCRAIGIELNPAYIDLSIPRFARDLLPFGGSE